MFDLDNLTMLDEGLQLRAEATAVRKQTAYCTQACLKKSRQAIEASRALLDVSGAS